MDDGSQSLPVRSLVWLGVLSLDAPLVAVTWLWLVDRSYAIDLNWFHYVMLANSVWLVYAGDRVLDAIRLGPAGTVSPRRRFAWRHRPELLAFLTISVLLNTCLTLLFLSPREIAFGAGLLALVLAYLLLAQLPERFGDLLPLKEILVALLFTAGTLLFPGVAMGSINILALPAAAMFLLFLGNCVLISYWEIDRDRSEDQSSLALKFPGLEPFIWLFLSVLTAGLTLTVLQPMASQTRPVLLACLLGSFALLCLHLVRDRIYLDARRTLADLVLLTPLVLILMA